MPGSFRAGAPAALLAALLALACSSVTAAPLSSAKYFVWRVTNLPVPFYLVGSIHNLTARDYPLPEAYRTALTNSQRLLFECSPRERSTLNRKFLEAAKYPDGQDIESEVRPAVVGLLKKNGWRLRMNFDQLRHYRPWAIALLLLAERGPVAASSPHSIEASLTATQSRGDRAWNRTQTRYVTWSGVLGAASPRRCTTACLCSRLTVFDNYLSSQAERSGKEVGGLETVDEHVDFCGRCWNATAKISFFTPSRARRWSASFGRDARDLEER
jgi:uncharacterized protein YbaP (TraB family)